jgi:hexosaminidase
VLSAATPLVVPSGSAEAARIAAYLADKLRPATGFTLNTANAGDKGISLALNAQPEARLGTEGYRLEATSDRVTIRANAPAGLFYGVQTLLQLLPGQIESKTPVKDVRWEVPAVTVTDYPRFAWRGLMLDVSRHFFPKEYVKAYIDQMARYKYNRFHWHLTDDQGWRIEIKSLPRLTEVGAWRVPRVGTFNANEPPRPGEKATYGGFYTQDDIREIVQYAKERYIEILPEIDVPGHSMAALAAYPELSCTKDPNVQVNPGSKFATWHGNGTFTMHIDNTLNPSDEKVYGFLDKVFTEVAQLFPFEYVHMGGDECYKGFWAKDPGCQALMKKLNLKNMDQLQAHFNRRVAGISRTRAKDHRLGRNPGGRPGPRRGRDELAWPERRHRGGPPEGPRRDDSLAALLPRPHAGRPGVEVFVYSTVRLKSSYNWDPCRRAWIRPTSWAARATSGRSRFPPRRRSST